MKVLMYWRYGLFIALFWSSPFLAPLDATPESWISKGVGGGGAFFSPSISPHEPQLLFVNTDMGATFKSSDNGKRWETLPFSGLQGGNVTAPMQFTSDPRILYALNGTAPYKSVDGGEHWSPLPGDPTDGNAWSLYADPQTTSRVIIASYSEIYLSTDGGETFTQQFSINNCHIAGVFFDREQTYVATPKTLLISTNAQSPFAPVKTQGIPADEDIVSFGGAREGSQIRFYCCTLRSVYPGITGANHAGYRGLYRMDPSARTWIPISKGIPPKTDLFFVALSRNNTRIVYAAGEDLNLFAPAVYKTTDGGNSWDRVFRTDGNDNIFTGWQGHKGDRQWSYGEYALGLAVCPTDPQRAIITDLGFVHITVDGGETWRQTYVNSTDENPMNTPTPKGKNYRTSGLENTSCWWLSWPGSKILFAGFTDILALRSTDAGLSWSFNFSGLNQNTIYQLACDQSRKRLYAAASSVHDLYQSTYLDDQRIDRGTGALYYSGDKGASWKILHDFKKPVIALALDPKNSRRMLASIVNSREGGLYLSEDIHRGNESTWTRLSPPPRTQGHPFQVHILNDGTFICSYSGRRDIKGAFTPSSGVFLSSDQGATWMDRSHTNMFYWTKDLVLDPHDPKQSTWYACVFSGWGGKPNRCGGLYRTVNRGQNWSRICPLEHVESCTVDPTNPRVMYVTTEDQGLWLTTTLHATQPVFSALSSYPFRHPTRVFFNPYRPHEIWVTSFGNGLRVGIDHEPVR